MSGAVQGGHLERRRRGRQAHDHRLEPVIVLPKEPGQERRARAQPLAVPLAAEAQQAGKV
jgi:hypothetical protein